MIFKTRPNIKKQFNTVHDFGFKNLIVSGCSFTYNNHENSAVTWPYYLKDLGGFDQVLDCSLPGSGNHHICNSLQWAIELDKPDPNSSLVIVMWSGYDRDDYICPETNIKTFTVNNLESPFKFNYSKNVASGITAGMNNNCNTKKSFKEFTETKSLESRGIENYLYITGLYNFLQNNGYKFLFLDYLDRSIPSRTTDFEIIKFLPPTIKKNLSNMMTKIIDPYTWAVKYDFLTEDDFHPSPNGHLDWTQKVLLPKLQTIIT
jgi:hypothetical protein